MHFRNIFVIGLSFYASQAAAEMLLNNNIMRCNLKNGLQRDCAVPQNLEVLPRQEIESDFYVSYALSCDRKYSGPKPSTIQLRLDSGSALTLNYKDAQSRVLVGSGMGPMTLTDSLPQELANRSFGDCQLSFSELRATPSAKVRAVWEAELNASKELLDSKIALAASLEKVALLLPAYQLFQSLNEQLQSDLKQSEDIVALARELSSCKQGEDCDLLFKLGSDTSIDLSLEERILVIQLRGLLTEVSQGDPQKSLKIDERLSEASIKTLKKLASDAAFYEDAENRIRKIFAEAEDLRGKIATLEAKING